MRSMTLCHDEDEDMVEKAVPQTHLPLRQRSAARNELVSDRESCRRERPYRFGKKSAH